MLRMAIDTCVIVAAQKPDHLECAPCSRLFDLARAGAVELLVSSSYDYDQETNLQEDPAKRRHSWLAGWLRVTRVSGPATLDVSRLDVDALPSDSQGSAFATLAADFGLRTDGTSFNRRGHIDLHHYQAAIMAGADAFVTSDGKGALGRLRRASGTIPLQVLTPDEAVALALSAVEHEPRRKRD